jgi:hypothetical protein
MELESTFETLGPAVSGVASPLPTDGSPQVEPSTEVTRTKAEAFLDFLRTLNWRQLPAELVTSATAADLDGARAEILRIASAQWLKGTFSGGYDWELRQTWERCRHSHRAAAFGAEILQVANNVRLDNEKREQWKERVEAGFVVELSLSGSQIDKMIARQLFPADGDREDLARLAPPCCA